MGVKEPCWLCLFSLSLDVVLGSSIVGTDKAPFEHQGLELITVEKASHSLCELNAGARSLLCHKLPTFSQLQISHTTSVVTLSSVRQPAQWWSCGKYGLLSLSFKVDW